MRNRLVLQSIIGTCPTIDVTAAHAEAYARKVGADYRLVRHPGDAPSVLAAILTAKSSMEQATQEYRQTLFLDADVYCRPTAPDVFALVPLGHIGAWCEEGRLNADSIPPHPMYPHGHFNSGVLVWPSEAHGLQRRAAELCISKRSELTAEERARCIWDQTPMNKAVAESGLPVVALGIEWNHHQTEARVKRFGLPPVSEAHFVHFAGGHHLPQNALTGADKVDQSIRAEQMLTWIKENG